MGTNERIHVDIRMRRLSIYPLLILTIKGI